MVKDKLKFCNKCTHYQRFGYCDKVLKISKLITPYASEIIKHKPSPMVDNKNNDCKYFEPDNSDRLILIIFIVCIIFLIIHTVRLKNIVAV